MTNVFKKAMAVFWVLYLIGMYELYVTMEAKIPEYIKTEVIRAR